jgi:uncharacterized metal-binding protein YceD (DUF177 family)
MAKQRLSHVVRVRDVPPAGKQLHLEANRDERAALAEALGIPAVERLEAELNVTPAGEDGLRVRGHVEGDVVQTCIVTLDPVRQSVRETINVTFQPEDAKTGEAGRTVLLDAMDEEELDYYTGGRLDLGPLVREHLALGLDPYPRKPDSDFQPHIEDDTSDRVSPFEGLRKLKDGDE